MFRLLNCRFLMIVVLMSAVPAMANTGVKPEMLYGKWEVVKVETNSTNPDVLQSYPVIRDFEIRSDGTFIQHWGFGAVQKKGQRIELSQGSWGMPASFQVAFCANSKSKCNNIMLCIGDMLSASAQCLDITEYAGDRMRARTPSSNVVVIEYQLVRSPSATSEKETSSGDTNATVLHPFDFAETALTEFRLDTGVNIKGLPNAYQQTIAALRGELVPNASRYATTYLVWFYHAFKHRQEGAKPPPVITSQPDTAAFRVQMAHLKYMLEISEMLRRKKGNDIFVSYGKVVSDVGATYMADSKTGRNPDFNGVLAQAVDQHYGVTVDPDSARKALTISWDSCEFLGGLYDPLEGSCKGVPEGGFPLQ